MRAPIRITRTVIAIGAAAAFGVAALATVPASAVAPTPLYGCTITGTKGDDVLRGTAGVDVICGLGGADKLYGLGGNDILRGGAGDDELYGGKGDDVLNGGKGNDELDGDSESDGISNFTMGVHFQNKGPKPIFLKDGGGTEWTHTVVPQPLAVPTGNFLTALFFVERIHATSTPSAHYTVSVDKGGPSIGDIWWIADGTGFDSGHFKAGCYGQVRCQWVQNGTEGTLTVSY